MKIIMYEKEDGTIPVENFLNSVNLKLRAKIVRDIKLLEEYGPDLREPYSKAVGKGIFELRTKQGSDITRILYFFRQKNAIILTNGFVKKGSKLPKAELELAIKYKSDFIERTKGE